ncbi:MAG: ATP-binding protein, partial [Campylobacteraceae bacterium]|nr:ATP-binding protein [Campylobacteraceae bacterium]
MLNKIILLNCANYDKAVIELDADSIQIVGRNNGGKTTLISALNFLYVPNQKEWNFAHSPKETLRFYFKQLDKSYLLFEIYKNSYFCILLRKDERGLAYYKIDLAYSEAEFAFFGETNGKTTLLDFESVQSSLLTKIEKLSDKDYRALLFGETTKDKSVLWLEKNIKQSTFSRI